MPARLQLATRDVYGNPTTATGCEWMSSLEVLAPDGSLRFCRPSKWHAQSNHCHEQLRQLETVLGLTMRFFSTGSQDTGDIFVSLYFSLNLNFLIFLSNNYSGIFLR